jgi:hypothetical protein
MIDGSTTDGHVPFYALPYVRLRGVAAMRFQGETAVSVEGEIRRDLDGRWSILAFGGGGEARSDVDEIGSDGAVWAGGAGFRYLIARRMGLRVGLDVARGPDEWVFYIQVGHAWLR